MNKLIIILFMGIFLFSFISADTQSLTMRFIVPDTEPEFATLRNFIAYINEDFSQSITATSSVGISCYTLNDTSKFDIDCNGLIENKVPLNATEIIYLTITANNTIGEEVSGNFHIDIKERLSSAICRYKSFGYYNTNIPFLKEVNCL